MFYWMNVEYRIVRDTFGGYEVQVRRWWHWPLWVQASGINTHTSLEKAEIFAEAHASVTVKYLGRKGSNAPHEGRPAALSPGVPLDAVVGPLEER